MISQGNGTSDLKMKEAIISAFNEFTGKNLARLDRFYARDIHFIDPVHDLKGLDRLKIYYESMYKNVKSIHFDFHEFVEEGNKCTGSWTMRLAVLGLQGGDPFDVEGISAFHFNSQGLVSYHRDYFDLGSLVYERIPVQGMIIRKIKNLLRSSSE
jgi:hypothetical protein